MKYIIGTAGHVDHGKTTLVKALTGMDTDRLAEEKSRGLSIEAGYANMAIGEDRVVIIDLPGHERFISNMLSGVSAINLVLFCIAADDSIMPQTREHLDIINLLGIRSGIFVITKSDLVSRERLDEVIREVSELRRGTSLKAAPLIAVSAERGEGIEELKEAISRLASVDEVVGGPFFRLPVDRVFQKKGFGTVVTGTVASGFTETGKELYTFPGGDKVRVRGIESIFSPTGSVKGGERGAINIAGASTEGISRSWMVLSEELRGFAENHGCFREARGVKGVKGLGGLNKGAASKRVFDRQEVDVIVDVLQPRSGGTRERPLKERGTFKVHHFTDERLVEVRFFKDFTPATGGVALGDGDGGGGGGVTSLYSRLYIKEPIPMLRGDRFILRDPATNTTLGGGMVLATYLTRRDGPPPSKGLFDLLGSGSLEEAIPLLLPKGGLGLPVDKLKVTLNISDEEVRGLVGKGTLKLLDGYVLSLEGYGGAIWGIKSLLEDFHKENPSKGGIGDDEVLTTLTIGGRKVSPGGGGRDVVRSVIDEMVVAGEIIRDGSLITLVGHTPALKGPLAALQKVLGALFKKGGGLPPPKREDLLDAAQKAGFKEADLKEVLAFLVKTGEVVKVKEGLFVSGGTIGEAESRLKATLSSGGEIKASEFRDILGCGRKLAIEILEYFDKERITLRRGDVRTLR